jgi:hypothetical protein
VTLIHLKDQAPENSLNANFHEKALFVKADVAAAV